MGFDDVSALALRDPPLDVRSTALSHGYPILTDNLNQLQRIPGLEVIAIE